MAVRLDSCTECWVLLIMSSTGNDVLGAALYFTVCVGQRESVCVCVCVCRCLCLHSTADAWAVLSAMDSHPLPLAYIQYITTPSLRVVYCSTLTHPYPVLIMDHSPSTFRVKLDS